MGCRTFAAAVLGAGAMLLAACSQGGATEIGPPEAGAPARTTAGASPTAAGTAGTPSAPASSTAAGISYKQTSFDVPLATTGWATVRSFVPDGWALKISTAGGPLLGAAAATFDRRDPTGARLVRFHFEPNPTGQDEGAFQTAIAGYRTLPGAHVTVAGPTYRGDDTGLTQQDWTVRLPVDGTPRLVLVRGWLLDNQLITAYVSVPAGADATAADLFKHATDLSYEVHSGPSPTPPAG